MTKIPSKWLRIVHWELVGLGYIAIQKVVVDIAVSSGCVISVVLFLNKSFIKFSFYPTVITTAAWIHLSTLLSLGLVLEAMFFLVQSSSPRARTTACLPSSRMDTPMLRSFWTSPSDEYACARLLHIIWRKKERQVFFNFSAHPLVAITLSTTEPPCMPTSSLTSFPDHDSIAIHFYYNPICTHACNHIHSPSWLPFKSFARPLPWLSWSFPLLLCTAAPLLHCHVKV